MLLHQAGFYHIKLGVESFDAATLDFMGKPYKDPEKAVKAIKLLKKYHLTPTCFMVLGMPTQTEGSILRDIQMFVELALFLSRRQCYDLELGET